LNASDDTKTQILMILHILSISAYGFKKTEFSGCLRLDGNTIDCPSDGKHLNLFGF